MEIVITSDLWRMGFRDTVTLYTFLYHLERSHTHECITTMIKKTNLTKKVGSGHGELSITLRYTFLFSYKASQGKHTLPDVAAPFMRPGLILQGL